MLKTWLAHPLTRGLDIDDPRTTHLRLQIIQQKSFLRRIYQEWYRAIVAALPTGPGAVLELGAGGGFMCDFVPNLITSELFYYPSVQVLLNALQLPFATKSLRGIVMTNVLHHLPQPRLFFAEATRCVRAGGAVVMIEPWVTPWSRFVYNLLHHEPFDPETPSWNFQLAVRFPGQMMRCRGLSSPEIGRNLSKSFLNGGLKQSSRSCLFDTWCREVSPCAVLPLFGASGCGVR
jgi:hypothetical protein